MEEDAANRAFTQDDMLEGLEALAEDGPGA